MLIAEYLVTDPQIAELLKKGLNKSKFVKHFLAQVQL